MALPRLPTRPTGPWTYALATLLAAGLLAACAAYQYQHRDLGAPAPATAGETAAAPAEFRELTDERQVARVRGEVEEAKANLARKGKYACCVHPSCNQCLLQYGECGCRHAVEKEGGPCCGECTEAWIEGRGAVEGISALELLERKKRSIQEKGQEKPPAGHHHHHP